MLSMVLSMMSKGIYGKASAVIIFVLISTAMLVAPIAANAATVTVTAYPTQNVSNLVINDTVSVIFTYPANSFISRQLSGLNYSMQLSAINIPKNSGAFESFQNALRQGNSSITLLNMSITESKSLVANATALIIKRSTIINAWVSGIFNKTPSGRIMGNFGWKSFKVDSRLDVDFNGHSEDINFIGNSFFAPMGGKLLIMSLLMSDQLEALSHISTINFSAFNTPLSQWTRTYNPSTNMTSFTKSVPVETLFTASLSVNNNTYSIRAVSDPSYTLNVQGYAVANGNTLILTSPPQTNYTEYAAVVVIVVIAVAGAAIYLRKR